LTFHHHHHLLTFYFTRCIHLDCSFTWIIIIIMTSIKEATFDELKKHYTLAPSEHHSLAKDLGGDIGHILEGENIRADVAESVALSRAFLDAGYTLPIHTFDGKIPTDAKGRSFITTISGWRHVLEEKLGTPKHIRSAHDLVGVHGIVLFSSNAKGIDEIVLWGQNQGLLVPSVDFAEARGGTFLWPLP
jgi:hypothetical protein